MDLSSNPVIQHKKLAKLTYQFYLKHVQNFPEDHTNVQYETLKSMYVSIYYLYQIYQTNDYHFDDNMLERVFDFTAKDIVMTNESVTIRNLNEARAKLNEVMSNFGETEAWQDYQLQWRFTLKTAYYTNLLAYNKKQNMKHST